MKPGHDPCIKFSFEPETLADILLAVYHCPVEISGLARVTKQNDLLYVVSGEPEIFEQECSGGGTDFDIKTYQDWIHQHAKAGNLEYLSEMRLWWHSHVYMRARFSDTDVRTIDYFGMSRTKYWASLVINKEGGFCLWLNITPEWSRPFNITRPQINFTRAITEKELHELMTERRERIERIVSERVRIRKPRNPYREIISGFLDEEEKEKKSRDPWDLYEWSIKYPLDLYGWRRPK